jgi:two-component system alkaline phosphatase synthesis response regulator PhoP
MTNSQILLVEDEPDIALIIADLLSAQGHHVAHAATGPDGLRAATNHRYDLLILDVMLPGLDGFALCQKMRQQGFDGGILMLTARGQVADRVQGLHLGADDYLAKPFDPHELTARVTALLRRMGKEALTPVTRFQFGPVSVDFSVPAVHRHGAPVNLAAKEMQLLRCLIDHRGQVLTREWLLTQVWSHQPFITPRTVDVHIAWLRQKLEEEPQTPKHILTVRGEGYRFTG